jgi:hypothetical protein
MGLRGDSVTAPEINAHLADFAARGRMSAPFSQAV